ncbi:MAG: sigma-54-dependent Fis family transcriptional regulator [Candidatus Eisenbacteria sp.]|nr:sigma-54-dependent Fis family transcriptional regulator [Candidatus Eisenbacteria bacterium]
MRILIVDDEKNLRSSLTTSLGGGGFDVLEADTGGDAVESVRRESPELVLLDTRLPDMDGLEVLRQIRRIDRDVLVIVTTADGGVDCAVEAMKLGAMNCIPKPYDLERIGSLVGHAAESVRLRQEARHAQHLKVGHRESDRLVLGNSRSMLSIVEIIEKVAASKASTILIEGENGTGKELVAKAIHFLSRDRNGPWVDVNVANLPENLIESELFGHEKGAFTDARARKRGLAEIAAGGTLFLDEIGEMPLHLQAKILKVIESKIFRRLGGVVDLRVDARIIAATNRDLRKLASDGGFREDLYFRLQVIPIRVPPLRERVSDILLLAQFFVEQFNRELSKNVKGFSAEAGALLLRYAWPGNVRELRNVIERIMILEAHELILAEHLPAEILVRGEWVGTGQIPTGMETPAFAAVPLSTVERYHILETLVWAQGNKTKASKALGISRQTLREKLKQYEKNGQTV